VPRCGVWAESGPAEGRVPEKPPGRARGAALDADGGVGAGAGRGPPELGGGAVEPTDEGGFTDAAGDEPGINRWGGVVAGTAVVEAVGAAAALTGSSLAEPAATGAGPTGLVAGAGRSSPTAARGATVGDADNDDGAVTGLGDGAAVADPLPAAG
jgi:hypothetical protein